MAKYFIDFRNYIDKCDFLDCTHIKEEKCRVKEAVLNGNIENARYENYIKIYDELKDKEEHKW